MYFIHGKILIPYLSVEIQLLHVLIRVPNPDERAQLRPLLRLPRPQHLLPLPPPAVAVQIHAGRGAEETLLIPVRLLGDLRLGRE